MAVSHPREGPAGPPLAASIAASVASISADALAPGVRRKVGGCLLDFLSACLDGASLPWSLQAVSAMTRQRVADGQSSAAVGRLRMSAADAAFVNAVLGGSTSQMDTFAESATHPGVVVFPAALSVSERGGCAGGELLAAVVAGYETMACLGATMYAGVDTYLVRPTAAVGPVAAAAAASRAMALSTSETTDSLAIAANTSAGLMEWSRAGTMDLVFHAGFAARNGVTACDLAVAGAHAAPSALDGPHGLLATLSPTARATPHPLSARGEHVLEVLHKPAPACVFVQSPCQLAAALVQRHRLASELVRAVQVDLHPSAIAYPGCDNDGPIHDPQAARMSIQHSVASVLVHGAIHAQNWLAPDRDPRVAAMAARCTLHPMHGKGVHASRVRFELANGTTVEASAGAIEPVDSTEIEARFARAAHGRLRPAALERVLAWADDLRTLPDVRTLFDAMSASAAAGHA